MIDHGPAHGAAAITPSDTTNVSARGLFVGTTGNLTVDMPDGQTNVVFKNIANGTFLPIAVTRVKAATTATDIVALF